MNTSAKVIGGFLAGAALGAVAGILLAPDSGSNTRNKVADESKKLTNRVADSISKSLGFLGKEAKKTKKKVENGKTALQEETA